MNVFTSTISAQSNQSASAIIDYAPVSRKAILVRNKRFEMQNLGIDSIESFRRLSLLPLQSPASLRWWF